MKFRPGRELLIATAVLALSLTVLPVAVYFVGVRVVGEYATDGGVWDLLFHVWTDLAAGRLAAWLLVLSPYLIILLLRAGRSLWKHRGDVSSVTVIDSNQ